MGLQFGKARFFVLGAVAFFLSAALAVNASATTIDIRFTATSGFGIIGSNSIDASLGDMLTATVSIGADADGVSSYGISVMFDMDFGDELDLVLATELLNPPFMFNTSPGSCAFTQESTGALVGKVLTCEAATFGLGPVSTSVDIIQLDFLVTANVETDGIDITTGTFNTGFDGVFDNAKPSAEVFPIFGTASVNRIPEPSTGILVGLGLGGLLVCSRKRSS